MTYAKVQRFLDPPPVLGTSGLDFAGNTAYPGDSPSPILVWTASLSVAPFPRTPATYIWKCFPRVQPGGSGSGGFWSMLFRAPYITTWDDGVTRYFGMHPYPHDGIDSWEVSASAVDTFESTEVVWNQWYTCVVRINGLVYEFYPDWERDETRVISVTDTNSIEPSPPALFMGDAKWNRGQEVPNAIMRFFVWHDALLTPTQINQEIAEPGIVRTPWYMNLDPTPTDPNDKSGNANHPAWDGAARPGLWEET